MPRLELPNDQWAELREPDEIPRKAARKYRGKMYDIVTAATNAGDGIPGDDDPDRAAAVGRTMMSSADGLNGFEDLAEAMVLAVTREWSFGSVCQEVLDELPDGPINAIYDACQKGGYAEALQPDFGATPDEDSPTLPS